LNPFSDLETSPQLEPLFSKFPTLRSQLRDIYKRTKSPEPGSEEHARDRRTFPDRGGARIDGRGLSWSGRGNWTTEKGFNQALSQLKRLRKGNEEDSEGLGEFSEFVHMVSPMEDNEQVKDRN